MRTLTLDDTKYLLGNGHESSPRQQAVPRPSQLIQRIKGQVGYSLGRSMTELRQTRHGNRCPSIIHCRRAGIWHIVTFRSLTLRHRFHISYILLPPTDGPMSRFMLSKILKRLPSLTVVICCIILWGQSCPF